MQPHTTRKKNKLQPMDINSTAVTDLFPQVRYFQVHFEYLHELLNHAVVKIDSLNKQVNQLEKRLASTHAADKAQRRAAAFDTFTVSHPPLKDSDAGLSNSSRTL